MNRPRILVLSQKPLADGAGHTLTHEEHKTMRQWAGRNFHPEKFDLQATDKAVKAAWRKGRGDYLFRRQ